MAVHDAGGGENRDGSLKEYYTWFVWVRGASNVDAPGRQAVNAQLPPPGHV
jgi:hypothetical protein